MLRRTRLLQNRIRNRQAPAYTHGCIRIRFPRGRPFRDVRGILDLPVRLADTIVVAKVTVISCGQTAVAGLDAVEVLTPASGSIRPPARSDLTCMHRDPLPPWLGSTPRDTTKRGRRALVTICHARTHSRWVPRRTCVIWRPNHRHIRRARRRRQRRLGHYTESHCTTAAIAVGLGIEGASPRIPACVLPSVGLKTSFHGRSPRRHITRAHPLPRSTPPGDRILRTW
jgi:hypothetical protein